MFKERRLVQYLNTLENQERGLRIGVLVHNTVQKFDGIDVDTFLDFAIKQEKIRAKGMDKGEIEQLLDDCIEEELIRYGTRHFSGVIDSEVVMPGLVTPIRYSNAYDEEGLSVRSAGREYLNRVFFYTLFLKKINFWEAAGLIVGAGIVFRAIPYIFQLLGRFV